VAKDKAQAHKWVQLAANQGHAGAINSLGYHYGVGDGVAKDEKKAVELHQVM
jgi:TPR repeat protein